METRWNCTSRLTLKTLVKTRIPAIRDSWWEQWPCGILRTFATTTTVVTRMSPQWSWKKKNKPRPLTDWLQHLHMCNSWLGTDDTTSWRSSKAQAGYNPEAAGWTGSELPRDRWFSLWESFHTDVHTDAWMRQSSIHEYAGETHEQHLFIHSFIHTWHQGQHSPGEVHPLLNDLFRRQSSTDDPNKVRLKWNAGFQERNLQMGYWRLFQTTHVVFMQSQMMCGQHSDSQARAKRWVQEATEDSLVLWWGQKKDVYLSLKKWYFGEFVPSQELCSDETFLTVTLLGLTFDHYPHPPAIESCPSEWSFQMIWVILRHSYHKIRTNIKSSCITLNFSHLHYSLLGGPLSFQWEKL